MGTNSISNEKEPPPVPKKSAWAAHAPSAVLRTPKPYPTTERPKGSRSAPQAPAAANNSALAYDLKSAAAVKPPRFRRRRPAGSRPGRDCGRSPGLRRWSPAWRAGPPSSGHCRASLRRRGRRLLGRRCSRRTPPLSPAPRRRPCPRARSSRPRPRRPPGRRSCPSTACPAPSPERSVPIYKFGLR